MEKEGVQTEKEAIKAEPLSLPRKRKAPPMEPVVTMPISVKPRMASGAKEELVNQLQSLLDLPDQIVDFFKQQTHNLKPNEDDELVIDIESLNDETLFELRQLLDDYFSMKQPQVNIEPYEFEVAILVQEMWSHSRTNACLPLHVFSF